MVFTITVTHVQESLLLQISLCRPCWCWLWMKCVRESFILSDVSWCKNIGLIFTQDEKNQIITTNCWLNQAWIDYKLQWDPTEYGGLKVVRIPYDAIWRPDILLYNKLVVCLEAICVNSYLHWKQYRSHPDRNQTEQIYINGDQIRISSFFCDPAEKRRILALCLDCGNIFFRFACFSADVSAYKSSISTNVIVTNDGNITWLSMMIFRSSCAINVKYFPFDEQNCSMLFSSWTYDGFQVICTFIPSATANVPFFRPNMQSSKKVNMIWMRNEDTRKLRPVDTERIDFELLCQLAAIWNALRTAQRKRIRYKWILLNPNMDFRNFQFIRSHMEVTYTSFMC